MTGGAGFSKDAMSRSRQNRNMLKNITDNGLYKPESVSKTKTKLEVNPIDQSLKEKIKKDITNRNRRESLKTWGVFILLMSIVLTIILILKNSA